ncbi:MAG: endonuclease, partial [Thiomicrorhabdus sp.]|nr:endonuclease [Thiomicrorhabdus sp.]
MSFEEKINALAAKIPTLIDHLETEEATKNALIMPFIAALGYDVFNPQEVVPEFVADHGTKKGEKVDYAIMQNNEVIILIECKQA